MGADVADINVKLAANTLQFVREEYVGRRCEPVENVRALGGVQVEPDTLFSSIGMFQQHMHVGGHVRRARGSQASHGIPALDMLYLDHLSSQVGQHRGGGRDERLLGDLQDPYSL